MLKAKMILKYIFNLPFQTFKLKGGFLISFIKAQYSELGLLMLNKYLHCQAFYKLILFPLSILHTFIAY